MKEKYHHAVNALMQTDKLHRMICEKRIGTLGIHRSQHIMLMSLEAFGRPATQSEIAQRLGISTAAVAVTVKKLEAGGYITRTSDESDQRSNIVSLTENGQKIIEESKRIFEGIEQQMTSGITRTELDGFLAAVKKMETNIKEALNSEKMV